MNLYVLTAGPVVYGVFSSRELAKAAGEGLIKDLGLDEVMVHPCLLDVPRV